jgi:hypothetical protein
MGHSFYSHDAYDDFKTTAKTKSVDDTFTNNKTGTIDPTMNPFGLAFRESRDSLNHPNSFGVAVWLDVTGSMGSIPINLTKNKLNELMDTLMKHGMVDAQVLFGAIGDHRSDRAPLQVGQFETGTEELIKCLTATYLEGNGGGQHMESYLLAWLIAARHTSMDCFEKRGQKGILFTIGDEATWDKVDADSLKKIMGYAQAEDISAKDLLAEAQRSFHVFHIHCNEGSYRNASHVLNPWRELIGERLILCENQNEIPEIIASTVAVMRGIDLDAVVSTFSSSTAANVKNALVKVDLSNGVATKTKGVKTL